MRVRTAKELGAFIRSARRDAGLSQTMLAARLNVGQKWLSEVENGKATAEIGMVLRLLAALGTTVDLRRESEQPDATQEQAEAVPHRPLDAPGDLRTILDRLKGGQ